MSIDSKHAYRFGYLKSDQWKNVRLEALVREKGCCEICGQESISNDAHHIWYPQNIYDTTERHLAVVCRACHDFLHAMLPECKTKVEEDGIAAWLKFKNAIIAWRLAKDQLWSENPVLYGLPTGIKSIRKAYETLSSTQKGPKQLRDAYENLREEHNQLLAAVKAYQESTGIVIPHAKTKERTSPFKAMDHAMTQVKLWAEFYRAHLEAEKNTVDTNFKRANENQNEAVLLNQFGHRNSKSE